MRLVVTRINGNAPATRTDVAYDLPDGTRMSVSNALQYINRRIDGSMAYYLSCRRGLCAACIMRIDGRNVKACVVEAVDGMKIEPVNDDMLVKDTVVHFGVSKKMSFSFDAANGSEGS